MRRLSPILATLAALLAAPVLLQRLVRAQTGPLPLASTFEVHALVVASAAAVLAVPGSLGGGRSRAWTRLVALGVLVLAVVRLGGELWSPAPDEGTAQAAQSQAGAAAGPAGAELRILSWNLEQGSKAPAAIVAGIRGMEADVVALQELEPAAAEAIDADRDLKARFPYRILEPGARASGMGLLSRLPLLARGSSTGPMLQHAGLLLADGRVVDILNTHPYPPGFRLMGGVLPVSLDTRRRDEDLARLAKAVEALDSRAAAIVVGDLNAAPTEPGFDVLTAVLTDAHAAVGIGPGFTWRPAPLESAGLGFLRIDHVLAGAVLRPLASAVDCTAEGDHCRLLVTLRVEAAPAS
jgi:endonuclease/exonuclease/phosphatase (EEP) superfamily protein YafD